MLRIQTTDDPKGNAAAFINSLLVTHADKPVLLMLAGGSSREIIDLLDGELLTDQVTITVTDERYTDDLEENNFAYIQGTSFYNASISAGSFCIDTQIFSGESHKSMRRGLIKISMNGSVTFQMEKSLHFLEWGRMGILRGLFLGQSLVILIFGQLI